MENVVYGKNKSKLKSREDLLKSIRELERYYNKETINHLVSLVELEKSVFSNMEFASVFGELDLIYDIFKYNICNRTIKVIENIDNIDKSKIAFSFIDESFIIWYMDDYNREIKVMEANFAKELFSFRSRREVIPCIFLYKYINVANIYDEEGVTNEINNIINNALLTDWNIKFDNDSSIKKFSWIEFYVKDIYNIQKTMKVRKIVKSNRE